MIHGFAVGDVTRALHEKGWLPGELVTEVHLNMLIKIVRKTKGGEPDSLGHPDDANLPPLWRRWRITYAGRLDSFKSRMQEIAAAEKRLRVRPEEAE